MARRSCSAGAFSLRPTVLHPTHRQGDGPKSPDAVTTGPYTETVTNGVNQTVAISGEGSNCTVFTALAPPTNNCTYTWELSCEGAPPLNFTGINASLIAGPGGDVDTTGLPTGSNVTCNLTLTLEDGAGLTGTAVTTVTVTCARLPQAVRLPRRALRAGAGAEADLCR